jgi:transcriptional regulator with XRE-family HTH domain
VEDIKLARFLRTARENAGLTQTEVAKKLGYGSSQFVSNWERGRSTPPMNALRPLSKMYKINMDELFEHIFEASVYMTAQVMRKEYSLIKKRK